MPKEIIESDVNPNYTANKVKQVAGEEAVRAALASNLPNETNTQRMARITQAYKDQYQPTLTPEQEAAGAQVKFVRTGAAGEGEYRIVYPIGVGFDPVTGKPTGTNAFTDTATKSATSGVNATGSAVTGTSGATGGGTANLTVGATNTSVGTPEQQAARQSAYDLLLNEFKKYGLESLVKEVEYLIKQNVSPSQFAIELQNTRTYQDRFAANQDRIKAGLRALTPAEYIGLEDQYQNIMRNYGLPASYYSKDSMGTQAGFNKFIANDVSAAELEDRIATAQKRVINADVNVTDALRQFYPDITNADILAYTLDPTNALENIKRKVTAAEIGGAALQQGLGTNVGRAEELAKYGVTKAQAQQGYQTIGEFLPAAEKLGDIYAKQGLGAYDQATAESEIFGTANAAEAAKKRKKLAQLEQAQFGGTSGTAQGALARERAGNF
jgi:hypothetical protein